MIPVSIDFVNDEVLDKEFRKEIDKYIEKKVILLKKWLNRDKDGKLYITDQNQRNYIEKLVIKGYLKRLVYAEPKALFEEFKPTFNAYAENLLKRKKEDVEAADEDFDSYEKEYKKRATFKNELVNSKLNYGSFRDKFLRKYFHRIGIKACVYCNANLVLTLEKGENETSFKAKYQVDHYLPKAIYPCFAISLFNFIPSCAACNHAKSDDFVHFTMYSNNTDKLKKSRYSFDFSAGALPKYRLDPTTDELRIQFKIEEEDKPEISLPGAKWEKYNDVFDIEGIYNMLDDVAEEICRKSQIYSQTYRDSLKKDFPTIFNDQNLSDRMILGNYATDGDIHKRPLSKFMQDIARRVGLIDESKTLKE